MNAANKNVSFVLLATAAIAAIGCFVASLPLPCLWLEGDRSAMVGWVLLLWGPFGVLNGVIAWYANLLLPVMLVLLLRRKYRLVVLCGVPCLALALSTLAMRQMVVTERPDYATVIGYGPGFYLWLASLAIPPAAALALPRRAGARKSVPAPPPSAATGTA